MNIAQSAVGSAVTNCTHVFANWPQLANPCQLETQEKHGFAENTLQLAVGNAANLPTGANPHACSLSRVDPVGENSPSYYVGEGTKIPSSVRREAFDQPGDEQNRSTCALLAIDLGTQTGWALQTREGTIVSGSESFKPSRFEGGGMRFLRFKRWLTEIKQTVDDLDAVYFEEVRRHAGVDAAHAYGGFMGQLTAWSEHHRIPYQGVPVGTIKKHATGKGNASKEEMIAAARRQGFDPDDDNEADALALLAWAIAQHREDTA